MRKATLIERRDEGNPRVRFDEGKVASVKPRCWSFLCKIFELGILKTVAACCVGLICLTMPAKADYTVTSDRESSGQVEGSHRNCGHEHVIWNITVPSGSVAHVSVFGTMSSVSCSERNTYLVFTGDSEEHYFGGYADGITYNATFSESSRVILYANATPGKYSEPVVIINPITGAMTLRYRYVTYSAYTCTLKYKIKITYEKLPSHTVTYRPGTYGSGAVLTQAKLSGLDLQLKGVAFTRSGYSQGGWSINADGSTLDYSLGDSYSEDEDLTLYPYWSLFEVKAGLVSLTVSGGTSVSPGGSLNLTCKANYSDGTVKAVTPQWLVSSSDYASITTDGVLTARPYISGLNVSVIAGFEDKGSAVTKTVSVSISKDSKLVQVVIPPKGGDFTSSDFDASQSYWWYFDTQGMPSWVSSARLSITSGSSKNTSYDFTRTISKYNLNNATANFSFKAAKNDTGDPRWWAFTAKDDNGVILKNFVFLQHPISTKSVSSLYLSGTQTLKSGEKSLYRCEAAFSNGTAYPVRPKWSITSGEDYATVDSDGVLTANEVTSAQKVMIQASYKAGGVTETKSLRVTVNPVAAAKYDVSYKPGADGIGSSVSVTKTAGRALTLKGAIYTREGYEQTGWSKKDGGSKKYDLGESYTEDSSVTLYPFWTQKLAATIKIVYHPGAYGSGESYTYEYSRENFSQFFMLGETYVREGFRQTAWARSDGGSGGYGLHWWVSREMFLPKVDVLDLYPVWTEMSSESPFQYNVSGGKAVISKYVGPNGEVVVPATLGGYAVAEIGYSAFYSCERITSVTLPEGVAKIGDKAFEYCTGLLNVSIPSGVTSIGGCAFENCYKLTSVTIPGSVTNINGSAFAYCIALESARFLPGATVIGYGMFRFCRRLKSVTIPSSVTSIGETAFLECDSLKTIYVDAGDEDRIRSLMKGSDIDCDVMTFLPIRTYTITYSPGANGVGTQALASRESGETLTLEGAVFSRRGYKQTGWTTTEGGEKMFDLGAAYAQDENVTLYPAWAETDEYEVFFGSQGAEMSVVTFTRGRIYSLPPCTETPPTGKHFAGWRCEQTGKRYDDGMLVFDLAKPGEIVIMTAIWE